MLMSAIFACMLADADNIPEGDAEDKNKDEDNVVPLFAVAANNVVKFQLNVDFYHNLRNVWINELCVCLYKHV